MMDKSQESRVKSQKRLIALRSYSGSRLLTLDSRLSAGMTLIELLVVIVILTTIVGAAIPLVSPSNDDRRLREAARTLNTYITGAQTRAISTKRPYGIALKRLSRETGRVYDPSKPETLLDNDDGVCLEVFYVEQPAPYAGFDANSRAMVAIHPTRAGCVLVQFVTRGQEGTDSLPIGWDADLVPPGLFRPGDVIEINGTRFELLVDNGTNDLTSFTFDSNGYYAPILTLHPPQGKSPIKILARPINNSGQLTNPRYDNVGLEIGSQGSTYKPPWPYWAPPAPYKILRQPTPASDEPYQLPEGTAIDLRASGIGTTDYFYVSGMHDNDQDVLIMFTPEGRVERVAFSTLPTVTNNIDRFNQPVVDNIFLLVGRRENIEAPAVGNDPTLQSTILGVTLEADQARLRSKLNWLLGNAHWIVIGSQSGRIATIENAFVNMAGLYSNYVGTAGQGSEPLRNEQIKAAREFTREMKQMMGR